MLKTLNDTLNKSCLVGLSYFDVKGTLLKQSILAGKVISVDKENGITLELMKQKESISLSKDQQQTANFLIPVDLSCWFKAPAGDFHTSIEGVKITNPDYLVTWDIYQSKAQENSSDKDNQHQWWQWKPRTTSPQIG